MIHFGKTWQSRCFDMKEIYATEDHGSPADEDQVQLKMKIYYRQNCCKDRANAIGVHHGYIVYDCHSDANQQATAASLQNNNYYPNIKAMKNIFSLVLLQFIYKKTSHIHYKAKGVQPNIFHPKCIFVFILLRAYRCFTLLIQLLYAVNVCKCCKGRTIASIVSIGPNIFCWCF